MSSKYNSHIHSLEGLHAEKAVLRLRIAGHERDLQQRLQMLPIEVVKATLGRVVPFFLSNRAAGSVWMVVRGVFGLFFKSGPAKTGKNKRNLLAWLKEWGLTALVKALVGLFTK